MEMLRYTPPDKNPNPERQLELRYIRVDFPTPTYVLGKSDTVKPVWETLKSLGINLYKGMITGASYNSRVTDRKPFRAVNLTKQEMNSSRLI